PAQEYTTVQPSAATGTAQAQTAAAQPVPAAPGKTLGLSAPSQVRAGSDFAVAVSMPPGTSGSVRLDLVYDSAKLLALGAEGTPGRVSINVAGPTTVRFRALEGQSGSAQITVGSIIPAAGANAAAAPISAPAPLTIDIMR